MNRAITIGLIGIMLFLGIQYGQQEATMEELVDYLSFTGTITEVGGDGVLVQDKANKENLIMFNISEQVLLLDDEKKEPIGADFFEVGQEVTAYYPEDRPMALSFPGIITPDVLILRSNEDVGFVHVSGFDATLTSSDGQLKITLGSGMTLVDRQGNPVTSLANKTLIVFYTTSTRSIPAQTTPEKIIVF